MSITDYKTFEVNSMRCGGGRNFAAFSISIPASLFNKPPVSVKVLNTNIRNTTTNYLLNYTLGILNSEQDTANNHVRIISQSGAFADIYFPTCLTATVPGVLLPSINISGFGPNPLTSNDECAQLFTIFMNEFIQPAPPIGLGITITCIFVSNVNTREFHFTANSPYTMVLNIPDSIGLLWGLGLTTYVATDSTTSYLISSLTKIIDWQYGVSYQSSVYIISDLVYGCDSGLIDLNPIVDSNGILVCLSWIPGEPAGYDDNVLFPFISIKNSNFVNLLKNKIDPTIRFWIKSTRGYPILNRQLFSVLEFRLVFAFNETDAACVRIT
jgi:hypothetical protein